jgi:hypothetical protein
LPTALQMSDKGQDCAWRTLSRRERVACPYQPQPLSVKCQRFLLRKKLSIVTALFYLPLKRIFDQRRALKNRPQQVAHSWKSGNFCTAGESAGRQKRGAENEERVENALC